MKEKIGSLVLVSLVFASAHLAEAARKECRIHPPGKNATYECDDCPTPADAERCAASGERALKKKFPKCDRVVTVAKRRTDPLGQAVAQATGGASAVTGYSLSCQGSSP